MFFLNCFIIADAANNFIQQHIGPTTNQSNDQIYFIIIFVLILIILAFIIYLVLKFQLLKRRQNVKEFHHTWLSTGAGDSEHISHTSPMDLEDPSSSRTLTPTLLLIQQQDGRFYNKPIKGTSMAINSSSPAHVINQYPMENIAKVSPKQLLDKYHLVSQLNSQQNGVDHFIMQPCAASGLSGQSPAHPPKVPLPTIPKDDNSLIGSFNRYEEPEFKSPQPKRSKIVQQKKSNSPVLPGGTNSSSGSANTATTTANEISNESEPDYAEPMISEQQTVFSSNITPAPPVPPILPPIKHQIGNSPRYSSSKESSGSSLTSLEGGIGNLCNNHEKFVKINTEIVRYGHYSAMAHLGVALYLPPSFIQCSKSFNFNNASIRGEFYIRYGIDTRSKISGLCSLSSVITLNMSSNNHQQLSLNRPVVLCFRHCLSCGAVNNSQSMRNLVILWQQNEQKKLSKWTELIRFGETKNSECYFHLDSSYVYLVTRLFGRFAFGIKMQKLNDNESECDSISIVNSELATPTKEEESLSKLVNFSLIIEQFSPTEHLIKCFVYDNLPGSVFIFENDQISNNFSQALLKIMIGRMNPLKLAYNSSLRISVPASKGASLCFEIQAPFSDTKSSRRMEIPLDHFCLLGPNSMLNCSFIVVAPPSNNMEKIDEIFADNSDDSQCSSLDDLPLPSPTYENNLKLSQQFKDLNYDIKVWQQKPEKLQFLHSCHPTAPDFIILNRLNMNQLCQIPSDMQHFYQEDCCRLFGDSELEIRRVLIESFEKNDSRQKWMSTMGPYLVSSFEQNAYKCTDIGIELMELWESKTITEIVLDGKKKERKYTRDGSARKHCAQQFLMNPMKIKELFYAKLLRHLQAIRRPDLVDLILGYQF